MKKVSIYRPTTVDEAIQIPVAARRQRLRFTPEARTLLIRLKNRLEQAPSYLVDIKKIDHLRYIKERCARRRSRLVRPQSWRSS